MTRFYWHIHHDVLLEPATELIAGRRAYIRRSKPRKEVALRLRLLHKAVGLPSRYIQAQADYDKAGTGHDKARADCGKAWADYDKAWAGYEKARADRDKAQADYGKAWADRDKAWADYEKARVDYDKAQADSLAELLVLHAEQCPNCPWDGHTIFPLKGETTHAS